MRNLIITILIACLAIIWLTPPVRAQMVTIDEALTVANNWIDLIIQNKGDWGGSRFARVGEMKEFKRGERILGYFCSVEPQGFIVTSLHKTLAPVKAYSANCNLYPESDEGMTDLIKGGMERVLNRIEEKIGKIELAPIEAMENILEINYRHSWEELESGAAILMNYQEGEELLTSAWHQGPPYNDRCPWMGCSNSNGRAIVGCLATAGAQIMRYWNWPPDTYDWPNMPDTLTTSSPAVQINAVAELCYEVGDAADMNYGCDSSWGYLGNMEDAYEDHFRYSTACVKRDRNDYSAVSWFNRIKSQLNANRPVLYRVPDHFIVGDGWQETGSPVIQQYHMNYGWGGGRNAWYTLDALHMGDPDEECMLENIYPAQALGNSLSGTYSLPSFPYHRYFDRDATGSSAIFRAGHYLQFLPRVTVTCTSTTGGSIRFEGSSSANTRFFSRGDTSRGIKILDGAIRLYQNGSIKFH